MIQRRASLRKQLVARAMEPGLPMLLGELRWMVLQDESKARGEEIGEIDRSQRVSFARTIREHCPDLTIAKVAVAKTTPVGLLARCAVYRLHLAAALNRFLGGPEPTILCRFQGRLEMPDPQYEVRYVIPQRHAVTFRFFPAIPIARSYETIEGAPGTLIPATRSHEISVVTPRGVKILLDILAQVPWKLFGHDSLEDWFPVRPADPLDVLVGRGPRARLGGSYGYLRPE